MKSDPIKTKTPFIAIPDQLLNLFLEDMRSEKPAKNKLNTTDFIVYIIYLKGMRNKYHYSWLANETIAKKAGLQTRTVGNSIKKLQELGYIYRFKPTTEHKKENNGLSDSYCTIPLIRMTTSYEPIIDEREKYKNNILSEIIKKQNAADHRRIKKVENARARQKVETQRESETSKTPQDFNYLGDDVPF